MQSTQDRGSAIQMQARYFLERISHNTYYNAIR